MKKAEQLKINGMCQKELQKCMEHVTAIGGLSEYKKLRTCNARVFETEKYYILQSYCTLVAFIDKSTDTLYDVLRYVYGYTSTSSQHISKFEKDYCNGKWNCKERYTWRAI